MWALCLEVSLSACRKWQQCRTKFVEVGRVEAAGGPHRVEDRACEAFGDVPALLERAALAARKRRVERRERAANEHSVGVTCACAAKQLRDETAWLGAVGVLGEEREKKW